MGLNFASWSNKCGTEPQNMVVNCSSYAGGSVCKNHSDKTVW
jgi:hypothetical protein